MACLTLRSTSFRQAFTEGGQANLSFSVSHRTTSATRQIRVHSWLLIFSPKAAIT